MNSKEFNSEFHSENGSFTSSTFHFSEPLRPYTPEEITILDMSMLEGMRKNGILGDDAVLDVADRMPYAVSGEIKRLLDIQPEEELDQGHI